LVDSGKPLAEFGQSISTDSNMVGPGYFAVLDIAVKKARSRS
jgi:hypothetical protein